MINFTNNLKNPSKAIRIYKDEKKVFQKEAPSSGWSKDALNELNKELSALFHRYSELEAYLGKQWIGDTNRRTN